jgi:hypothetical protein
MNSHIPIRHDESSRVQLEVCLSAFSLKIKAASSIEQSVSFYQTTWSHISARTILQSHRRANLYLTNCSAAALCRQMEANIKIMFFWSSTPCRLPNMCKLFGRASFLHLHIKLFYPEHAANMLLRNIRAHMQTKWH